MAYRPSTAVWGRCYSDRMLCERLRELEEAAIVLRRVSAEPPVRVDYELSEKGRVLEPALAAIGRWAERWVEVTPQKEERRAKNAQPRTGTAKRGNRTGS